MLIVFSNKKSVIYNRSAGWADALIITKTRVHSGGAWVERYYGQDMDIPEVFHIELHFRNCWNKDE